MVMNHLKTVGSHLLIWVILVSCLKHGRMKELHFSMVQEAIEVFLESITIGFEPGRFVIYITSVKK